MTRISRPAPLAWGFDRSSHVFTFRYRTARAAGGGFFPAGSVTEIAVPALVFPHGYSMRVRGGAIVSRTGAPTVLIAACPAAKSITVTVAPGSARFAGCRASLQLRVRPHVARVGHATTYRFTVTARLGSYTASVPGARWGLFEDSPEKLRRDIQSKRVAREREDSIKLLAEARKLYGQGNYHEAKRLADPLQQGDQVAGVQLRLPREAAQVAKQH